MSDPTATRLDLRTATTAEMQHAMNLGVYEALRARRLAGLPVVTWDRATDRIVIIPAEEIVLPGEDVPTKANELSLPAESSEG